MKRILFLLAFLIPTGCSSGTIFVVTGDEEIKSGVLELNGQRSPLVKQDDRTWQGTWDGPDASGEIQLWLANEDSIVCPVGYTTHGIGRHEFVVTGGSCEEIFGE